MRRFNCWKFLLILSGLLAALSLVACQGGGEAVDEEPPAGERAENPQHGVALAAVPGFFNLVSNDDAGIVLQPADPAVAGTLRVVAGPAESGGINLVAATQAHKDEILARGEDAVYNGQRELGSQLGTAFYSRGNYTDDGGQKVEETVVFLVHPWNDRTLQLIYIYPLADDTAARIQEQLFSVLGEVEPLGSEPPAADSESVPESGTDAS